MEECSDESSRIVRDVHKQLWETNEAESTSTQVVETVEGRILGTEDVTEQNENNENLVEEDKTCSSIQEEDLLGITPGNDDVLNAILGRERFPGPDEKLEKLSKHIGGVTQPKPKANEGVVENTCWSTTIKTFLLETDKVEWIILFLSFFLEILAAICDQFHSPKNPHFALTGMCLASVALFLCICELIIVMCKKGGSSRPRLEMFPDIFGLICGISQWLSTIATFVCTLNVMENPFKVNLLPVIFLGCLGAHKLIDKRCKTENWIELSSIVHVPNNGPTPDEAQGKKGY